MTTATVVQTRNSPHGAPLTPSQIKARRRAATLSPYELKQNLHEQQVYGNDPCGGSPHKY
jgi:hypothetical protein